MNLIIDTIQKEKTRIEYMLKQYRRIMKNFRKVRYQSLTKTGKNIII